MPSAHYVDGPTCTKSRCLMLILLHVRHTPCPCRFCLMFFYPLFIMSHCSLFPIPIMLYVHCIYFVSCLLYPMFITAMPIVPHTNYSKCSLYFLSDTRCAQCSLCPMPPLICTHCALCPLCRLFIVSMYITHLAHYATVCPMPI